MKRYEIALKLDELIGLNVLLKSGFILPEEIRDKDIYLQYDAYLKQGMKSTRAKEKLSDTFDIGIRQIERILEKMRS